jgi:hypothetical protein
MAADPLTALTAAAKAAWTFTLPLIEVASPATQRFAGGAPVNTLAHGCDLVDHAFRDITTPNNDTLYSSAHIDLSRGPVTVTLPAAGDRYISLALMDAYTNNFTVLGTRTTGGDGGTYTLVAPWAAAEGPRVIRSPTRRVWALARILAEGTHDLEAARAAQAGFGVQGPAVARGAQVADRDAAWPDYFASAARLLAENPPPVTDEAMLAIMAPLRLADFDPARFSPAEVAAIEAGVQLAKADSRRSGLRGPGFIDGWTYPYARLGDFGQEYGYRAAVALGGLAALPPEEAMYMRAKGDLPRAMFDGRFNWRLRFPAGGHLPVNSFWSLSLYEGTEDGQFFFADNPLGRYTIGDRTPGLTANPDGSLDIWISHEPPGAGRQGNWLPAPQSPFALFMRAYLPKPELLHGSYRVPPVEKGDDR